MSPALNLYASPNLKDLTGETVLDENVSMNEQDDSVEVAWDDEKIDEKAKEYL